MPIIKREAYKWNNCDKLEEPYNVTHWLRYFGEGRNDEKEENIFTGAMYVLTLYSYVIELHVIHVIQYVNQENGALYLSYHIGVHIEIKFPNVNIS